MIHTIRVIGPGIDHHVVITSLEDIEAARAVLDKIERELVRQMPLDSPGLVPPLGLSPANGGTDHG